MTQTPAFEDLLALVQDRSDALRSSVAGSPDLDVRVPSCPDWSLRDLVEHLTQVHRFWAAAVVAGPSEKPPTMAPADDTLSADPLAGSAAATQELIVALRTAGPAGPSWLPGPPCPSLRLSHSTVLPSSSASATAPPAPGRTSRSASVCTPPRASRGWLT
ncbi:maleylpyruvate isomerase family mycothiol-dependent enzyme [Streptomyces lydicus]